MLMIGEAMAHLSQGYKLTNGVRVYAVALSDVRADYSDSCP